MSRRKKLKDYAHLNHVHRYVSKGGNRKQSFNSICHICQILPHNFFNSHALVFPSTLLFQGLLWIAISLIKGIDILFI